MTKVYCANIACKYLDEDNMCKRNKIELSYHSVMTVNDGRQEFVRCKQYEMSSEAQRIYDGFKEYFEKRR